VEEALGQALRVGEIACQHLGDTVDGRLPDYIAGVILADGFATLRALQEVQRSRRREVQQRQRLQAVIVTLTALMARVQEASVFVGAGFEEAPSLKCVKIAF